MYVTRQGDGMAYGFGTEILRDGTVVTAGPLSTGRVFNQHDVVEWARITTIHKDLARRTDVRSNRYHTSGLEHYLEKRAAAAIGHCSLAADCRLEVTMPGTQYDIVSDGNLQLRCPPPEDVVDGVARTNRERCKIFHDGAPGRLAAFVTEVVTEYQTASEARQAATKAYLHAVNRL